MLNYFRIIIIVQIGHFEANVQVRGIPTGHNEKYKRANFQHVAQAQCRRYFLIRIKTNSSTNVTRYFSSDIEGKM